jgi:hypothetical protein
VNPFRFLRRRAVTREFLAAWAEYERANAAAADLYEALPVAFNRGTPLHRCACGTQTANDRCRWCQRGK